MTIQEIKESYGICGLVCSLCSYNTNCSGCKCKKENCEIKECCTEKGLNYCFECDEYPCAKDMHKGMRLKACFFHDFGCYRIVTKAVTNATERILALMNHGYAHYPVNAEWDRENYYIKRRT